MPVADQGEKSNRGSGRLKDMTTLIAGADSGIGRAVAQAFAREEHCRRLIDRAFDVFRRTGRRGPEHTQQLLDEGRRHADEKSK
jgi:NAD(P)-dependent dehydrogenase (short-subunit alcohol dehydrogenase family)